MSLVNTSWYVVVWGIFIFRLLAVGETRFVILMEAVGPRMSFADPVATGLLLLS